jgi:CO/xanthine dehydrogenase Mo-binding subunit
LTLAPPRPGARVKVRGVIGEAAPRADSTPKVKGEFQYASDLWREGMLHGATLRSPHAHASIKRIDVSAAAKLPGVRAILSQKDVPGKKTYGLMDRDDQPVLADRVVRFVGEPVAIVAADSIEQARAAVRAIVVEYEPRPAIFDPIAAIQPKAPSLHPKGNVLEHVRIAYGDQKAKADVVVEGEYEFGMQDQAALGPEAGLAIPREDGGVTLYVATQWLHEDLDQLAPCLGLPESKVRIVLAGVGGAFGAREDTSIQIHACLLALRTKRAVRMTYGREESFFGHVHRHPARLFYAHGASKDGRLVFVRASIVLDGGAYASSSSAVVANAGSFAAGPYRVANALVECIGARTNNPPTGAMRGFGAVQSCFGYEAQMDKLAAALGMSPVEIRAQNGLAEGDAIITGQPMIGSAPISEIVRRCAALPLPDPEGSREQGDLPGGHANVTRGEGVVRGVGYAVGFKNVCYSNGFDDYATARVRLLRDADGPVARVHTAACEVGQGITTVQEQIARTELGIERVELASADTDVGSAGSSSASRQTWMTGSAVMQACREVRGELERRARTREIDPARVEELLDEPIERTVTFRHRETEPRGSDGQSHGHVAFMFAAHRAVVDVDAETGLMKVVQVATAQDVGKAINPLGVIGQIEGGIAQGVGLAVMEELIVKEGRIRNASFTDYLMPTTLDMPVVVADVIEHPHPDGPYGAKGVGEAPTISSTAAIVAAVRAATGRELNRVPVRPDDIVFGGVARSGWRITPGDDPRRAVRV